MISLLLIPNFFSFAIDPLVSVSSMNLPDLYTEPVSWKNALIFDVALNLA